MSELKRFGISMDAELLRSFDELITGKGYDNRSEAIRDLVRKEIMDAKLQEEKGDIVGIVSFIYDHERRGTVERLLDMQHHHAKDSFNIHLHLDEKMCLEIMIVRGNAGHIRGMADSIGAVKGVENCELTMMVPPSGNGKGFKMGER